MIFVSSDYNFPQRLEDTRLGFSTKDLTGLIFAGDVPPDKMYELLTTRWGMGHNLAETLIDHFGGHIYDILQELTELNEHGEEYRGGSQAEIDSVSRCLNSEDCDRRKMRNLLESMAVWGYYPLSSRYELYEREIQVISKYNVGGFVQRRRAKVFGDVWHHGFSSGIIPSSQSIRLVILELLLDRRDIRTLSKLRNEE